MMTRRSRQLILAAVAYSAAAVSVHLASLHPDPVAAPSPARSGPNPLSWPDELRQRLRASDDVLPPALPVHPVATVANREAIVPPQCYTRTQAYFNPCYVCHQDERPGRENVMNDADLQEAYSFSDLGRTNQWHNLFEDRRDRIAAISDEEILDYIAGDNYAELPGRLQAAGFQGWIPDLHGLAEGPAAFDEHGFARDGSHWVAYSYKPFPSTFWPTNGSTDDVMIRLPEPFRTDRAGTYRPDIYKANLAVLEARIKGLGEIGCLPVDESVIGRDLNRDGQLGRVDRITDTSSYVGAAEDRFIEDHLYPQGVEFLHTVRYVGFTADGGIGPSRRLKEVRYMKKWKEYSKAAYARRYQLEAFEKEAGNLPGYQNLGDWGLDNGNGWSIQAFIENAQGRLRVNTFEETLSCMGCHNSIGSTIDKTFSLARKVDGAAGWRYLDLRGMPDAPNRGEARGEIATYLERVGGGSEFRHNPEMAQRWFNDRGEVDHAKVAAARDVYELITPSRGRALALNKAYRTIVEDQDYIHGRDAVPSPPEHVYQSIENGVTPTLPDARVFRWDLVLDWATTPAPETAVERARP